MLRACPQCRQFYKPEEPRCPHCGREPGWKTVMAGVAAAALLGAACQTADPPPVPAAVDAGPPPQLEPARPLYGLPPRAPIPPPAADAGLVAPVPDAGTPKPKPLPPHKPPGHGPRPLYGIPIRDKLK